MIDLDRLKSTLMTSGLQQKDNALFQVINQLIDALRQFVISITGTSGSSTGAGGSVAGIVGRTYLTKNNETGLLPNSVQLLAGTGITFDDSVPNRRTINGASAGSEWSVLTNGDSDFPELVFVGGDVIMTHVP